MKKKKKDSFLRQWITFISCCIIIALIINWTSIPHKQEITIGDFKCYGRTEQEKQTCETLAYYKIMGDILKGYNITIVLDEVERRGGGFI